jgi:hypothetical protein
VYLFLFIFCPFVFFYLTLYPFRSLLPLSIFSPFPPSRSCN